MSQKPRAPIEVFVSHSSRNTAFAERLVGMLNQHGVRTFYNNKKNIHGAQQWHDEIGAALARCSWFIVILTPQAVASP